MGVEAWTNLDVIVISILGYAERPGTTSVNYQKKKERKEVGMKVREM